MYKNTGGKLIKVSDDLHYIKIQLLFNYKTRNYVGTIYGGHMYSSVDGIYVIQLIHILGDNYIVWDKSAIIKLPPNCFSAFLIILRHLSESRYKSH